MNRADLIPPSPPPRCPQVLCLSGHDPSGGAGIQADIEAIAAQGAHAVGVITALTVQDSCNVQRVIPIDADLFAEQLDVLLADVHVDAIKLGVLGDAAQVPIIARAIAHCRVPVVIDPVLRAGGGGTLAGDATAAALMATLLPQAWVLTPNAAEARLLAADAADLDGCAQQLLARGARAVLITGGDEPSERVENRLYRADAAPQRFDFDRVALGFHGAGCTLASAIAAHLALGASLDDAVCRAQTYVQASLARALQIGRGRAIPGRFAQRAART